jgi:hypothetical protein
MALLQSEAAMQLEIQNPLHRLYMFLVLQAEFGRPDGRETAKLMASNVALGLDRPDGGRVMALLAEFDASAEQEECHTVLAAFYKTHVSVHHHPPVRKLKPIPVERIAPPEVRRERMERWGYDFSSFWTHGSYYGLPQILDRDLGAVGDSLVLNQDPAEHAHLLNLLNGGSFLDYEGKFPECADIFAEIKVGKFHLSDIEADKKAERTLLSTADIMLGAQFHHCCTYSAMPPSTRARAGAAIGRILDSRVSNEERGILHHELRAIFGTYGRSYPDGKLMSSLESAVHNVPPPRISEIDVVITLNGGDLGAATYRARQEFGGSVLFMPIGGQSPHQAKEGLGDLTSYSESDEMRATLLLHDYRSPFEAYPDHPILHVVPQKLAVYDVLPSDHTSIDTAGNAAQAKPRLALLSKLLHRPLNIVVASSGPHALRARTEFREALSPEIAQNVHAFPVWDTAIHTKGLTHFKPVAIGQTFCEYLKRLYAVSVV